MSILTRSVEVSRLEKGILIFNESRCKKLLTFKKPHETGLRGKGVSFWRNTKIKILHLLTGAVPQGYTLHEIVGWKISKSLKVN